VNDTTRRVAAGAAWLYAQRWLDRLLEFASIVVLARLLSPSDFGLVAIAGSIVAVVEGLAAFGVDKALIRSRSDERELFDSAWTLSILRGAIAAVLMLAIAQGVTDASVATIVRVLAIVPLLNGLVNPRFVTFERDLAYARLAVLTLGAKLVAVAATVAAALVWRNAWALVVGLIVNSAASMILSYALPP
jgi:O-antigen/teichoic acid export membrane protein